MDYSMVGPALVLGLGCIGSSNGCGIGGMAAHAVMSRPSGRLFYFGRSRPRDVAPPRLRHEPFNCIERRLPWRRSPDRPSGSHRAFCPVDPSGITGHFFWSAASRTPGETTRQKKTPLCHGVICRLLVCGGVLLFLSGTYAVPGGHLPLSRSTLY